jgi:hypothetical protein
LVHEGWLQVTLLPRAIRYSDTELLDATIGRSMTYLVAIIIRSAAAFNGSHRKGVRDSGWAGVGRHVRLFSVGIYFRLLLRACPLRRATKLDRALLRKDRPDACSVRRARDLGFTLIEIRALLELAEQRDLPCAEARVVAAAHLGDVRAKLAALRKMEKVLVEMVARCADGATPECPILEALFETEVRTEAKT